RAELRHVSEDGDAPPLIGHPLRGSKRRGHRGGIGVVRVVHDPNALGPVQDLHPARRHLSRRHGRRRVLSPDAGAPPRRRRGPPTSLLKEPALATVRNRRLSTAAMKSFVVVFPVEPVTPITTAPRAERSTRARSMRARPGSSTSISDAGSAPGTGASRRTKAP